MSALGIIGIVLGAIGILCVIIGFILEDFKYYFICNILTIIILILAVITKGGN